MENKKVPQMRFNIIENGKWKTENWENALASEIFVTVNERNHPELPVLSASQEFGMIFFFRKFSLSFKKRWGNKKYGKDWIQN